MILHFFTNFLNLARIREERLVLGLVDILAFKFDSCTGSIYWVGRLQLRLNWLLMSLLIGVH